MSEVTEYIPYKIKDMSLVECGRQEIKLAKAEISYLVSLCKEHDASKPLAGEGIAGCLHTIIQTAVLTETLRKDQADYMGVTVEGPFKPEY